MNKAFEYKEAKELINYYKSVFERINNGIKFYATCNYNINENINYLSNRLYFNWVIENILKNTFISSIYYYKRAEEYKITCQSLLDNYKYKVNKLISNLAIGGSPLFYFFASKSKKIEADKAYQELIRLKEGLLIKEVDKITEDIEITQKTDNAIILSEYKDNKEEYKNIIKQTYSYKRNINHFAPIFDADYTEYVYLSSSLNKYLNSLGSIEKKIKISLDLLLAENLVNILKTIPVDELSRDRTGIRVKALKDANYNTLADIYTSTIMQISSIRGVSEKLAHIIKNKCENYAINLYPELKIKLSIDNKTKVSSEVVLNIYEYIKNCEFIDKINNLNIECGNRLKDVFDLFFKTGNGLEVPFKTEQELEELRSSYQYEKENFHSKYKPAINNIKNEYSDIKFDSESAWNVFSSNPVSFYNIIEKICPDILGNSDAVYGLPEELAKVVQSQTIFPDGLLCTLRKYQEWGVKFILHQEKVLLGDEMGLGKTIEAIATMVSLKNTGATHFLVVCPASVVNNWCREINKHSKLKVTKIHGDRKIRAFESWLKSGDVGVTNYESTSYIKFKYDFKYSMLVVDEAHYIKNKDARRTKNTVSLAAHAERLLFMTGTALENNVDEMISLIDILRPSIADSIKHLVFMASAPQFREKIAPVYYRRKREDVLTELPDKIESKEWCTLGTEEEKAYINSLIYGDSFDVRKLSWNVDDLNKSSKAKRLKEIVETAELERRKVLVFSYFLNTIDKIHNFLKDRCLTPINGSVSFDKRQEILDEFDKAPAGTVLLAQITTGGVGLNIQAASVAVICEPQLKPSTENQAISRIYRMGQSRIVLVYRLLCENTIDEKIVNILEEKQRIFDAFADKSYAAEHSENIDKETLGNIINEEIERIKSKGEIPSEASLDVRPIEPKPVAPILQNYQYNPIEVKQTGKAYYSMIMKMKYNELVQFLINKYGPAQYDYYTNENCTSKNQKVVRSSEGLFCHHIDENKAIKLSNHDYAINNPFEYQKKERLVYCNFLEHLLLHILIYEEFNNSNTNEDKLGIGGAVDYLVEQLNDYFNGYQFQKEYLIIAFNVIKDDYDSYILMLKRLYNDMCRKENYPTIYNKKLLSRGFKTHYESIFRAI